MSSYATRLATSLRNAFDAKDRVMFEQELDRMVRNLTYTGPIPRTNDERTLPGIARAVAAAPNVFDGTPHCSKHACDCKTWPQAKTCMHRRA
jgi:hypothetical protein